MAASPRYSACTLGLVNERKVADLPRLLTPTTDRQSMSRTGREQSRQIGGARQVDPFTGFGRHGAPSKYARDLFQEATPTDAYGKRIKQGFNPFIR